MLTINNLSTSYQFHKEQIFRILFENFSYQRGFLRTITILAAFAKVKVLIAEQPYFGAIKKEIFAKRYDHLNLSFNSLNYLKFAERQWKFYANSTGELVFGVIYEYAKVPIYVYTKIAKYKLLIILYFISNVSYSLIAENTNHLHQENCLKASARLKEKVSRRNKCIIGISYKNNSIEVSNLHKMVLQKQMIYGVVQ